MARRDEPAPPRDCTPDLPDKLDEVAFLAPREEVFAARVAGLEGAVRAAHARLIETELVQPQVVSFDLAGATLTDVRVGGIRAVSLTSREGRWRNVAITGGRIGTLDLGHAEIDGLTLTGLRLDYCSFAGAKVADLTLRDCTIGTWDLPQATLRRALVADTRVDEVDTRGLDADDTDLRGLDAAVFTDPRGLRGATLTSTQAALHAESFAAVLGIHLG